MSITANMMTATSGIVFPAFRRKNVVGDRGFASLGTTRCYYADQLAGFVQNSFVRATSDVNLVRPRLSSIAVMARFSIASAMYT